jgi:hypothetical protein
MDVEDLWMVRHRPESARARAQWSNEEDLGWMPRFREV